MQTTTATTKHPRKLGYGADPIKLDGAFCEYAKPADGRPCSPDHVWADWIYNGHRNQWVVRLNAGWLEDQVTETTTLAAAVLVWDFYCKLVDEYHTN